MPTIKNKPKIDVYSIMWNEEMILPYFLRHYGSFANRIFIFNDHSTDKTAETAKANPKVKLLNFKYKRGLQEEDFNECFQTSYKKYSRGKADWVMCVDADEFIHHPKILELLKKQRELGRQLIKATAYTMVSEKFPTTKGQIYQGCKMGYRDRFFDKVIVFDPSLDIVFSIGRHSIEPIGVKFDRCGLLLLHYKYLSRDFFVKRTVASLQRRYGLGAKKRAFKVARGMGRFDQKLEKVI